MKFSVSSTTLCSRLQTLSRVLASKSSLTVLECILFELKDGKLKMTGSDGENRLETTLEVNEPQGEGRFAIKAMTMINGLKEISEQPVWINVNEETKEVEISYQNGKSSFVGQSGEEYPEKAPVEGVTQQVTIANDVLLNGINRALFATADDELRPVMNGIFFDLKPESLTFVASDGHKLVRDRVLTAHSDNPTSFILPKKPARTLKEILGKESGDCTITFSDKLAELSIENFTLSCRLIDGRYPNYASVIPGDNPYHVTIDRQALIGALRRVSVFASIATSLVRLRFENNDLKVSAQDMDYSTSAEEHILCDYAGTPMSIGFKGTFLIDILNSIDSQDVVLQLADPARAGVIVPADQAEGEDLLMLLMPMMLND